LTPITYCVRGIAFYAQQQKSSKTFHLTNNSEDTCQQFVCFSIHHKGITTAQHILCTDTEFPRLAQTAAFSASYFCIILQSILVSFNLPKALVASEGYYEVVTAKVAAKQLVRKDAGDVVAFCT
jgi:hypothetical protein